MVPGPDREAHARSRSRSGGGGRVAAPAGEKRARNPSGKGGRGHGKRTLEHPNGGWGGGVGGGCGRLYQTDRGKTLSLTPNYIELRAKLGQAFHSA